MSKLDFNISCRIENFYNDTIKQCSKELEQCKSFNWYKDYVESDWLWIKTLTIINDDNCVKEIICRMFREATDITVNSSEVKFKLFGIDILLSKDKAGSGIGIFINESISSCSNYELDKLINSYSNPEMEKIRKIIRSKQEGEPWYDRMKAIRGEKSFTIINRILWLVYYKHAKSYYSKCRSLLIKYDRDLGVAVDKFRDSKNKIINTIKIAQTKVIPMLLKFSDNIYNPRTWGLTVDQIKDAKFDDDFNLSEYKKFFHDELQKDWGYEI